VEGENMALTEQDVADTYSDTAAKTVNTGPTLTVRLYDRLAHDVELAKSYIAGGDYENADSPVVFSTHKGSSSSCARGCVQVASKAGRTSAGSTTPSSICW